jgi:hypothetical protein
VRFKVLAIFSAPVFCRASFFRVFTSSDVQGFLVVAFAIARSYWVAEVALIANDGIRCNRSAVSESVRTVVLLETSRSKSRMIDGMISPKAAIAALTPMFVDRR